MNDILFGIYDTLQIIKSGPIAHLFYLESLEALRVINSSKVLPGSGLSSLLYFLPSFFSKTIRNRATKVENIKKERRERRRRGRRRRRRRKSRRNGRGRIKPRRKWRLLLQPVEIKQLNGLSKKFSRRKVTSSEQLN